MGDVSPRRLPGGGATTFDVRVWLADLGHCSLDDVSYAGESERGGQLTVTYEIAGERARVRVARMGGVAAAAWHLMAEYRDAVDAVVVPGGTRFVWRSARGTHA